MVVLLTAHVLDESKTMTGCIACSKAVLNRIHIPKQHHYNSISPSGVEQEQHKVRVHKHSVNQRSMESPRLSPFVDNCRYNLVYTLASSVIQLAETSWLSSVWTLEDISYQNTSISHKSNFTVSLGISVSSSSSTRTSANPLVTNTSIFSLGIALIEISYGQTIQQLQQASDLDANGNETPFTKSLTAARLLPDLNHREGEKYAEVVRRCIMGSFSSIRPTLKENTGFQEQFYMAVVEPLAQIYNVLK